MSKGDVFDLAERLEAAMGGVKILTLARRLAGQDADRQTIETIRRRIQKYLRGDVRTMQPQTRRQFETALGVEQGYFDPPASAGRRSLPARQQRLEAEVVELAREVRRLARRVRDLEQAAPRARRQEGPA